MNTTQEHLAIADIKDDIILLKDGGATMLLQVSAVNFGLLSEREQEAIVAAFAQMLNSLSFTIQIVVHSERLNISSYLLLLDQAQKMQTNPMLSKMITSYRQFIQTTIKENEVLDKKFYIAIPLFNLEVGIVSSKDALWQKVKTVLLPRRDQVVRQLRRIGLKVSPLSSEQLVEFFYNIYNGTSLQPPQPAPVSLKPPQETVPPKVEADTAKTPPMPPPPPPISSQLAKTHPFVVEELEDNA